MPSIDDCTLLIQFAITHHHAPDGQNAVRLQNHSDRKRSRGRSTSAVASAPRSLSARTARESTARDRRGRNSMRRRTTLPNASQAASATSPGSPHGLVVSPVSPLKTRLRDSIRGWFYSSAWGKDVLSTQLLVHIEMMLNSKGERECCNIILFC